MPVAVYLFKSRRIFVLLHLRHVDGAPTPNDAERVLLAIVIKRKISVHTRSRRGDLCIVRGYWVIQTCRRHGGDAFEYIQQPVTAWLHNIPASSLLPAAVLSG